MEIPEIIDIKKIVIEDEVVRSAISECQIRFNTEAVAIRKGWRGYLGVEIGKYVFIALKTLVKPSREFFCVIKKMENIVLFGSESIHDFDKAVVQIGLNRDVDLIRLHELFKLDFGFVKKKEPAIEIDSELVADQCGIGKARFASLNISSCSIWWQRWGGCLYVVSSTGSGAKRVESIANRIGLYQRLPYWEVK